jgi:hypothetical protein
MQKTRANDVDIGDSIACFGRRWVVVWKDVRSIAPHNVEIAMTRDAELQKPDGIHGMQILVANDFVFDCHPEAKLELGNVD